MSTAAAAYRRLDSKPTLSEKTDSLKIRFGILSPYDASERARQMAAMPVSTFCGECLTWAGQPDPENDPSRIREAFSGGSVGPAFDQAIGTCVLAGFGEAPDTTRKWVIRQDVPNYLITDILRVEDRSVLKPLPRGATAEAADLNVYGNNWRLVRFASRVVVDEQSYTNDSWNAIADAAKQQGRAVRRLIQDAVYSLMLSNPNLFDGVAMFDAAGHGNLASGGSSALAAASLATACGVIRNRTIQPGTGDIIHLGLSPAVLLLPPDLERVGLETLRLRMLDGVENIEPVVESRIGTAGVLDPFDRKTTRKGSATNWYLVCDGTVAPSIILGFLDGQRVPSVRQFVLPPGLGQWGIGWDIQYACAVQALDYREIYGSLGA